MIVNQSDSGEPQPKGDTPRWFLCLKHVAWCARPYFICCQLTAELGWTGLVTSDSFSILLQAAYDFDSPPLAELGF